MISACAPLPPYQPNIEICTMKLSTPEMGLRYVEDQRVRCGKKHEEPRWISLSEFKAAILFSAEEWAELQSYLDILREYANRCVNCNR